MIATAELSAWINWEYMLVMVRWHMSKGGCKNGLGVSTLRVILPNV